MEKKVAKSLLAKANEVAINYSNPQREHNVNGESFKVYEIEPLSAQSALVIYEKTTGKRAVAFFYHLFKQKRWEYFFLGAQHMLNLDMIPKVYRQVEKHNFKYNFPENDPFFLP